MHGVCRQRLGHANAVLPVAVLRAVAGRPAFDTPRRVTKPCVKHLGKHPAASDDHRQFVELRTRRRCRRVPTCGSSAPRSSDRDCGSPYPQALLMKRKIRRASASSLVTTNPPSPVVMCLPCWRLKQPILPSVPTKLPSQAARNACAQSSITGMPCSVGDLHDPFDVARIAEEVGDDDRLRSALIRAAIVCRRYVARQRIHVGKDRDRALIKDRR